MIYALMLFVTLDNGQAALSMEACARKKLLLELVLPPLVQEFGWKDAHYQCLPIPISTDIPTT